MSRQCACGDAIAAGIDARDAQMVWQIAPDAVARSMSSASALASRRRAGDGDDIG
jgi:hypothetical protein